MRILVVRRDNIGDLLCTTPLLDGLRAAQPSAWIGVLANTYNAEVLARNPAVDALFAYEKLKHRSTSLARFAAGRIRLGLELRRHRLDWVLVPAAAAQSVEYARSLRPANLVVGDSADERHEVLRTWAVGRALGVSGEPGAMRVFPDPARVGEVRDCIGSRPRVAVHLSARRPKQKWPEPRYVELVRALAERGDVMLLWAPGAANDPRHPGDDDSAARIREAVPAARVACVPTPDLATLVAALSLATSTICPDGGAMQLSAALGKPTVALFGDSPVERWRPWRVPYRVVRPASGDLADLAVGPVLDAHAELAGIGGDEHRAQ